MFCSIVLNKIFNLGKLFFSSWLMLHVSFLHTVHTMQENNLNYWYKRVTKTHTAYTDTTGLIPCSILEILYNCRLLLHYWTFLVFMNTYCCKFMYTSCYEINETVLYTFMQLVRSFSFFFFFLLKYVKSWPHSCYGKPL